MRKTALGFISFALFFFLFLPLLALFGMMNDWMRVQEIAVMLIRENYFTLLPSLLLIGIFLLLYPKWSGARRKNWGLSDTVWVVVGTVALIGFIVIYVAPVASLIKTHGSIISSPDMLAFLSPPLDIFLLWVSLTFIIIASIFLFRSSERLRMNKLFFGATVNALVISLLFSLFLIQFPFFRMMEEWAISKEFALFRNPASQYVSGGGSTGKYCPAPSDVSGDRVTVLPPNPPGVRDDIEIIGVTNTTIEQLHGNWPLDWGIYAKLVNHLSGSSGNVLLFDISFLDEKGIYGGNNCGVLFQCTSIGANRLVRQVDVLADSIAKAKNSVISDYPMETTDEARSSIPQYDERLALMQKKDRLRNVKHGELVAVWAKLPIPPAYTVEKVLDGMGYANVLKDDQGMNRWVPLVARIPAPKDVRAKSSYHPDTDDVFYPSIDLVVAAKYFGIDIAKDVYVDFLEGYVELKNIPEKTYEKLSLETLQMERHDIMVRPNSSRSIKIPIDRRGLMSINFRGGRYCFKSKEILDVSRMEPPDAGTYYQNKISLVAMYYATGVGTAKDIHLSPYGDMAGIEHHAYAINTILNQDFAREAPAWVNLLILLGVAILTAFYQPRFSTLLGFIITSLISLTFIFLTIGVSFKMYSFFHVFPTLLIQQLVTLIGFIGFRVLTEEENVKFIRNTFSKFVSQDVVDELLANPDAITLGGAKKEITVFFSDIRGFTTISESLGPEDLVHLLNEYLSEMTELIIEFRGTIDKYMGDAIMAFWGAPAKNDDHAYFACTAALAQYEALKELQKRWSERNIPVLDIGIGMNSGFAVVGNMGSSRRMDYTLMGDTVNLGSRLEGITKTYGVKIVISEYTYERVKDRVHARELDLVRVKGKLEPVRIYELMGLKNPEDMITLKRTHQSTTGIK